MALSLVKSIIILCTINTCSEAQVEAQATNMVDVATSAANQINSSEYLLRVSINDSVASIAELYSGTRAVPGSYD